ncbi:probable serine/threonine-protein kinase nek3 [Bactrocera tryoni]|uniref:probable serine/threonine-protein kinase nek3 n=1 Tax=Bactrocera tryoni TaxID=59916 RepID=UPI001A97F449|nr:probable serine/threonine-protein kinase nek3 [Bactrocera tryoni]
MEKGTILLLIGCLQILHCLILVNSENVGIATSSVQNALPNNTTKNNTESLSQLLNTTGSNANVHKNRNITPTGTENNTKSANIPIDRNNNKTEELGKNGMATKNSENKEDSSQNSTTNLGVITVNATDVTIPKDKLKTTNLKPGMQNENISQASNKTTEIKYITKPTKTTASTKGKPVSSNTTATTTTTTTTTTPKPKKPSITFGLGDFPILPGESNVINAMVASSSKLPVANDPVVPPNVQPSQELNNGFNYYSSRDYIVPIMTVLFTIPLAIGVVITTYRRFRDCWSTRHYRRMDFLVDGMYND